MMSGMWDDVHSAEAVACFAQILYGLITSLWVHPIGVAVDKCHWDLHFVYAIDNGSPCMSTGCQQMR